MGLSSRGKTPRYTIRRGAAGGESTVAPQTRLRAPGAGGKLFPVLAPNP